MMVGAADEEMIVDHEVAIVEEEVDMIVVDLLIDMIAVEVTDMIEIETIAVTVAIGMIERREDVAGIGLLQGGSVVHPHLGMVVVVALVPDRLEVVLVVVQGTGPEVHREEVMMIATGVDMMITGTMVVVVGALKTIGVGEAPTEGMVALKSVLRMSA